MDKNLKKLNAKLPLSKIVTQSLLSISDKQLEICYQSLSVVLLEDTWTKYPQLNEILT